MAAETVLVKVVLSAEVAVAMMMIGLEGEALAVEMRQATAADLYKRNLLSIGKAAELAGLSLAAFMDLLASKGVPLTEYTEEYLARDLATLRKMAM